MFVGIDMFTNTPENLGGFNHFLMFTPGDMIQFDYTGVIFYTFFQWVGSATN